MTAAPWWVRPGLDIADGRLRIAGEDAEALAREHGTPLFVYDRARFAENARALQGALGRTGRPFRLRFALKANPLPEVLEVFRGLGAPGTPGERRHRRLLAGRGGARPGVRLAARRDQLHRDERVRARPRRAARAPDPRQSRRDQPDRAVRSARTRDGDRAADRSGRRRRLQRPSRIRRRPADQVRHRHGAAGRRDRRGRPPRPGHRHGPFPRRLRLAGGRPRRLRAGTARRRSRRSDG